MSIALALAKWYHHSSEKQAQSADKKDKKSVYDASTVNGEDKFDELLRIYLNEPCLALIPTWVTPNSITLFNNVLCVCLLAIAYACVVYEDEFPMYALAGRCICGFLCTMNMVLDCLDGMKARRDKQSSRVGEVLDHSLDAFNIPLLAASLLVSMGGDLVGGLISMTGACTVYAAQLILYRYHHVMVIPPVSGPLAQFLCSLAHVGIGFALLFIGRNTLMHIAYALFIGGNIIGLAQNTLFFIKKLHYDFIPSRVFPFLVFCFGLLPTTLLHITGLIPLVTYCLLISAVSFRLNGRFLLSTLLGFRNKGRQYAVTYLPYCSLTLICSFVLFLVTSGARGIVYIDAIPSYIYTLENETAIAMVIVIYLKSWWELERKRADL